MSAPAAPVPVKQLEIQGEHTRLGGSVLTFKSVSVDIGEDSSKPLLKDFSYDFQRGERLGIVGNNGAGKTTQLRVLAEELELDETQQAALRRKRRFHRRSARCSPRSAKLRTSNRQPTS